jgi:hypothetical protein
MTKTAKRKTSANRRKSRATRHPLVADLMAFREFGQKTKVVSTPYLDAQGKRHSVPTYVNEYWTAQQRQANALHEVSYRACFKPQLPRFFVERLTQPGDVVYDPFMGRGTTPIEAALLGRVPWGCDVNPLSLALTSPRLTPPTLAEIEGRLKGIDFADHDEYPKELLAFYHPKTLRQLTSLKKYLLGRVATQAFDGVDAWIRMVALNRLTGHSPGFFSVYTLPPNQAVSVRSQLKINRERKQKPPVRNVPALILKKSKQLLKGCLAENRARLRKTAKRMRLINVAAAATKKLPAGKVSLVVTSPPFLDVVDYATDNWLRCWFMGVDAQSVRLTVPRCLEEWQAAMTDVFHELRRVLKPGGHVAFEVGEVRAGKIKLEETVLTCGVTAGLKPLLVVINDQEFTKTANCWGVANNAKGTNTNRIVVFQK